MKLFSLLLLSAALFAREPAPVEMEKIDITDFSGKYLSLESVFLDESGKQVRLGDFFKDSQPAVLSFVYFNCPMLCNMVLTAEAQAVMQTGLTPSKDFRLISISIDERDMPSNAAAFKENYIKKTGAPSESWTFLTGKPDQIKLAASSAGFKFKYIQENGQYAHAAGIFVIMPDGKIARTLYGIDFPPRDLRISILEASKGRTLSASEKFLLYCYHYDPKKQGYSVRAAVWMQAGGALSAFSLFTFIFILFRRERRRK